MTSWIVIATSLERASDFDVIGAFNTRDEAVAWTQAAFFDARWKDCLFRVKQMRGRDDHGPIGEFPVDITT